MAQKATFGLYRTRDQVENAVDELRTNAFRNEDISALFPDNVGTKDFTFEKVTKAPERTTTGVATAAIVGGTLGWLVDVGALVIPGAGPFIAAGPIMAAMSGVGVGATVDGLAGPLVGLGIPEYEAKRCEGLIKGGSILLSVHTDDSDWAKLARAILERTGADDVASTVEEMGDYANFERPAPRPSL